MRISTRTSVRISTRTSVRGTKQDDKAMMKMRVVMVVTRIRTRLDGGDCKGNKMG